MHCRFVFIAGALCPTVVVFLAGCSAVQENTNAVQELANVEQQCDALTEIFNKSLNGFRSVREDPRYHNKVTHWNTRYHLI